MEHKDVYLLESIISYCDDISSAIQEFNIDETKIEASAALRGMLAFFIIQIGETARNLSKNFINSHAEIEWNMIIGFRNHIVHEYGDIMTDILWDAVVNDIPKLRTFCAQQIR